MPDGQIVDRSIDRPSIHPEEKTNSWRRQNINMCSKQSRARSERSPMIRRVSNERIQSRDLIGKRNEAHRSSHWWTASTTRLDGQRLILLIENERQADSLSHWHKQWRGRKTRWPLHFQRLVERRSQLKGTAQPPSPRSILSSTDERTKR